MKEQIIATLRESEKGLRVREIAARIHGNHWAIIGELDELLKAGLVRSVAVTDSAQMEYYNLWQMV
jgi:predicted transcriptional regulator